MQARRVILLQTVLALAVAESALAQQTPQPGTVVVPEQRGYIAALAGAVSGPPTEPMFSVEYGENMHRNVQAYATFSYFENLMRQSLRNDLTTVGTALSALTGIPWELRGRDRGVAFTAGGKYLVGNAAVRPYIGAGAGIITLKRTVTEAHLGDVTAAVFNDFNVGEGDLSLATTSLTRPLAEGVVGVGIVGGNTYVDVGYRYRKAFRLATKLEFAQFTVGIGYKF